MSSGSSSLSSSSSSSSVTTNATSLNNGARTNGVAIGNTFYSFADVKYAWKNRDSKATPFDYSFWMEISLILFFNNLKRSIGTVLVVAAVCIILIISYFGFLHVLPLVFAPLSFWYYANFIFGLFLLSSILYHYILAVNLSPGYSDDEIENANDDSNQASTKKILASKLTAFLLSVSIYISSERFVSKKLLERNDTKNHNSFKNHQNQNQIAKSNVLDSFKDHCKKCNIPKPLRSHHCSVCNRCVLKMDHHCPWVNNCVGLNNYNHFISFLFWVTLTTFYVCILLAPWLYSQYNVLFPAPIDTETANLIEKPLLRGLNNIGGKYGVLGFKNAASSIFSNLENELNNAAAHHQYVHNKLSHDIKSEDTIIKPRLLMEDLASPSEGADDTIVLPLTSQDLYLLGTFSGSSAVCIAVGGLLFFHLYLIKTGMTTVEFYESTSSSKKAMYKDGNRIYDKGFYENLNFVFGNVPWWIGCLPFIKTPRKTAIPDDIEITNRLHKLAQAEENRDGEVREGIGPVLEDSPDLPDGAV